MTLLETLKSIGIEDINVLPGKAQRKFKDYNKILNSPVCKDKNGSYKPGAQQKLDDLAEDIIIEAKVFLKQQADQKAIEENQAAAEAEAARQKAQQEEANRIAKEKAEKDAQVKSKKSKGFFEDILGW